MLIRFQAFRFVFETLRKGFSEESPCAEMALTQKQKVSAETQSPGRADLCIRKPSFPANYFFKFALVFRVATFARDLLMCDVPLYSVRCFVLVNFLSLSGGLILRWPPCNFLLSLSSLALHIYTGSGRFSSRKQPSSPPYISQGLITLAKTLRRLALISPVQYRQPQSAHESFRCYLY